MSSPSGLPEARRPLCPARTALAGALLLALPLALGGIAAHAQTPPANAPGSDGGAAPPPAADKPAVEKSTVLVPAAQAGGGAESAGAVESGEPTSPAAPAPEATPTATPKAAPPPPPPASPAERLKWLGTRIDEILGRPSLGKAKIGVIVQELDSGHVLYARAQDTLFNPASNAKLVTTAAALSLLGPEFRFRTALYAEAVRGGEVQGNLYIKGSGDPAFVSEDLWKLVADLSGQGVRRVAGDIAVDDSAWDEVRVGPGFDQKDEDFPFRAPNGAVSLNYNACAVHVFPGPREGAPPRVLVEPASAYFQVVNQAKTVAKGRGELAVAAKEVEGHTEITVGGAIRAGSGEQVLRRRIAHPDLYVGYSLLELLKGRGIKVSGTVVRGQVPQGARTLASHASPPLGVIVRDVNKSSNNFMAEQLLKTLGAEVVGRPGTWPKGVEAVARFLGGLGIGAGQYRMTNGSGLYDSDRFSPVQLASLLRAVYHDFRFAADFVGSLALAGEDGTIGHRMAGGPAERYVRAKTGTLDGVSCLSGYAGAPGRLPLVFSILMNDVPESARADARAAQDAIAATLVTFLSAK